MSRASRVIGVDACSKGWVGITSDLRGYFASSIDQLIASAENDGVLEVVAIDIPIGLPLSGPRQADVLARGVIGKRAPSVFSTPVRSALLAATYAEAAALSVEATGKSLSQQAYALRRKILEVDQWVRSSDRTVIEVHPEVCFATMAKRPLVHSKSTWAGAMERQALLDGVGISLTGDVGDAGVMAALDDVLDAAAASWTARRFTAGNAKGYPSPPEVFAEGELAAAIWA